MSASYKKLFTGLQYYYQLLLHPPMADSSQPFLPVEEKVRATLQGSVRYSANCTAPHFFDFSSIVKGRRKSESYSSNPLRLCVQSIVFFCATLFFNTTSAQPNSDNQYSKSL